jgi:regulatory protein YycI of two-component signal transduction system YycFG
MVWLSKPALKNNLMQNYKSKLEQLCNEYDVQIIFEKAGCVIFYKNTQESDVISYDKGFMDDRYVIDNFEMVADLSKLHINQLYV